MRLRLVAATVAFLFVWISQWSTTPERVSSVWSGELTLGPKDASAQGVRPRPRYRGRKHWLRLDSSPQQATVYWDIVKPGKQTNPKAYGVAGYTPAKLRVPRGLVKIVIEADGFETIERELNVRRSQTHNFTLARATQKAKLNLQGAGAAGAQVKIDNQSVGTMPNVFELSPGRHQIEIVKSGFQPFKEWVELKPGENFTRDVPLVSMQNTGDLLVMGEGGGVVYLDGVKQDALPTLISSVAPGDHVVEVRGGAAPWRKMVNVASGKKTTVTVGAAGGTGTFRVVANEADVEILLDGKPAGRAPLDLTDVASGQHVLVGRKRGYRGIEQTVKLTPGERLLVKLEVEPDPDGVTGAILRVQSSEPNAEVFLDGASLGRAPIERRDLEPGKHFVVVQKDGFVDFKREVNLVDAKEVVLVAEMRAVAQVRFYLLPRGPQFFSMASRCLAGPQPCEKTCRPASMSLFSKSPVTTTTNRTFRSRAGANGLFRPTWC